MSDQELKEALIILNMEQAQLLHWKCSPEPFSDKQIGDKILRKGGVRRGRSGDWVYQQTNIIETGLRMVGEDGITSNVCQAMSDLANLLPTDEMGNTDWTAWPPHLPEPGPEPEPVSHPTPIVPILIGLAVIGLVALGVIFGLPFIRDNMAVLGEEDAGLLPDADEVSDVEETPPPATDAPTPVPPTPQPTDTTEPTPSPPNTRQTDVVIVDEETPSVTLMPSDTPTATQIPTDTPSPTASPTATPTHTPSPSIALPFEDNFENAMRPEWDVLDGEPVITQDGVRPVGNRLVMQVGDNLTNIIVELDYALTHFLFDAFNDEPQVTITFGNTLRFRLDSDDPSSWQTFRDGRWTHLASGAGDVAKQGRVQLVISGNSYEAYINGTLYSPVSFGEPPFGPLSITILNGGRIDNLSIESR